MTSNDVYGLRADIYFLLRGVSDACTQAYDVQSNIHPRLIKQPALSRAAGRLMDAFGFKESRVVASAMLISTVLIYRSLFLSRHFFRGAREYVLVTA